ncbi:MAG: glycoside hydrolase family 2 protein [Fimbriimonadaceae bacterium]|nr:glycoside hydrolase family 2 protein [Fimbriimonadaceae bacterium]
MLKTTYLHSEWEFAEAGWQKGGDEYLGSPGWLEAQVPGHVHLDLVRHGIIADPFAGMNELGVQWVDERDWSYRTKFDWQPDPENPCRALRFEGLDTVCSIFLNEEKVAEHDNMFVPLEFDVTDLLVAGTNTIRIDFQSAVRVGKERRTDYFAEQGLPEDTERFHERPFVRKAQYMSGWDWGPRLVSCGVWQPVKLLEYQARILEVNATHVVEDGKHSVRIDSQVEGDAIVRHFLVLKGTESEWSYDGKEDVNKYLKRPKGGVDTRNCPVSGDGVFPIVEPHFWSPDRPIDAYTVYSILVPKDIHPVDLAEIIPDAIVNRQKWFGTTFDVHEMTMGLSEVKLLQEPDQYGESFEFNVNGEPLWARGANWIPDHSFPSTITKAQLRDRLEKAKDMGFNMLRVWGGGLYESDDFYDLCDELGILVWQDFPFGCSYYPDTGEWLDTVRVEAEYNVKRLRNHPCLALWCGNNENEEMHYSKWGDGSKHPPRYYGENFYNDVLPDVVQRLDPKTPYIRTSPIGKAPVDDPVAAKQRGPNSGGFGDQHCWDVWHGRGDWKYYGDSTGRFSSEYGFASSCHLEVWVQVLDDWADEYPFSMDDATLKWHDKTRKGWETFVGYVKLHYPNPTTLADWVYYSQLNQRDALRFGVEHYRRSQFCKGSLIWQLNDCWPVQSWAILDCEGNYKALAYDLRRSYADQLLSIERHNDQIKLHAVNDGRESWTLSPTLAGFSLTGGPVGLLVEGHETTLSPGERKVVLETSLKGLSVPETLLVAATEEVSAWQLLDEPKHARFGEPKPIYASMANHEGALTLRLDQPVVDLFLSDEDGVGQFGDNFVTCPSAGVIQVRYWGTGGGLKARSLAGGHEVRLSRSPL